MTCGSGISSLFWVDLWAVFSSVDWALAEEVVVLPGSSRISLSKFFPQRYFNSPFRIPGLFKDFKANGAGSNVSTKAASIGVIGGSGFYKFLQTKEASRLETPYGNPSASVRISDVKGKRVAFIPRHGEHHEFPPHVVPYRANIYALKQLGVERVYGPTAVGSLKADIRPGDFVISDQFVNFTNGRKDTYFDGPETAHVGSADPYCPELRELVLEAV